VEAAILPHPRPILPKVQRWALLIHLAIIGQHGNVTNMDSDRVTLALPPAFPLMFWAAGARLVRSVWQSRGRAKGARNNLIYGINRRHSHDGFSQ